MTQSLYSEDCPSVASAVELFHSKKGLILIRPRRLRSSLLHFTVPSGCYALVSSRGVDLEYVFPNGNRSFIWPAGLHFPYPPWVRVSSLVTQQTVVLNLPVKACKTKDDIVVNVDTAVAFRIMGDIQAGEDPKLLRKFVHQLKPSGLEQQLRQVQDSTVRDLVKNIPYIEIYGIRKRVHTSSVKHASTIASSKSRVTAGSTPVDIEEKLEECDDRDGKTLITENAGIDEENDERSRLSQKNIIQIEINASEILKTTMNRHFMPQGVEILSVTILSCALPKEIETVLEEKTLIIRMNEQQDMRHNYDMQLTRMKEETLTLMQTFEEQKRQEEAVGAEQINEEKVKLNDVIAEGKMREAIIIEEGNAKVQKLVADNDIEVQRIRSRMDETFTTMKAESEKEAAKLLAVTKLEVERKMADASLQVAKNRAEVDRILTRAEGIIAPYLVKKNEYGIKLKQLDIFRNLALNDNLVLCDTDDSDINVIAVADSILSDSVKLQQMSRSSVIAELSLLQKASSGLFGQRNSNIGNQFPTVNESSPSSK